MVVSPHGWSRLTNAGPEHKLLNTYEDFKALTLKSKVLTVQETFAKQLMQMVSMTPAKALAIVQKRVSEYWKEHKCKRTSVLS